MNYTSREISEVAIGAGYPGRRGWYLIVDPDGHEVATIQPQYAESLTDWFNSAETIAALRAENAALRQMHQSSLESDSIVASCDCLTKTNEIEYHKPGCKYRLISERDALKAKCEEAENERVLDSTHLRLPSGLHPDTQSLVIRFATALAEKLRKAEEKYGYSDAWMECDWIEQGDCADKLNEHVDKGDPLDVAAYCAFLWYHGASTDGIGPKLTKAEADLTACREELRVANVLKTKHLHDCVLAQQDTERERGNFRREELAHDKTVANLATLTQRNAALEKALEGCFKSLVTIQNGLEVGHRRLCDDVDEARAALARNKEGK